MLKKLFYALNFSLIFTHAYSQQYILHEYVNIPTKELNNCPNCRKFSHFYGSYGMNSSLYSDEANLHLLSSYRYTFGYRIIIKLNKYFSTGFIFENNINRYRIKQEKNKNVHDSILHIKEIFLLNDINAGWYYRINFDKRRGMYIGHFVDIGAYAGFNYKRQRFTKNKIQNDITAKTWYKKIEYINKMQHGLFIRVGLNRYVFCLQYRISDIFQPVYEFAQLPAYSFGLEIGFHR